MKTPGQVAYEAYFKFSDGKSLISGSALPLWHEQALQIRGAWEAAATTVLTDPALRAIYGN